MPDSAAELENLIIEIDFDKFPARYTCDGEDVSPRVKFSRIRAKSLALIMEARISPEKMFTHWLIWNIDPMREIPEGIPKEAVLKDPMSAVQGTNDFGKIGYNGPCPLQGKGQIYYFNVYGLDILLNIPSGSGIKALREAMRGHMVQYGGEAIATYQR
jgi:Raf kinase inhibitor-like YbhB/YbcL family protein